MRNVLFEVDAHGLESVETDFVAAAIFLAVVWVRSLDLFPRNLQHPGPLLFASESENSAVVIVNRLKIGRVTPFALWKSSLMDIEK